MATKTAKQRGFKVRCPLCGAEDALRVDLDDLRELTCTSCDGDFRADDVRVIISEWQVLLSWLESAPPYPEDED